MCGSSGIPLHFEPNILGAEWYWCLSCGTVTNAEGMPFDTLCGQPPKEYLGRVAVRYPTREGERVVWVTMPPNPGQWQPTTAKKQNAQVKKVVKTTTPPMLLRRSGGHGRQGLGDDKDVSPHFPKCPFCGDTNILAEAVHDGFVLKLKGEMPFYPRRLEDDGVTKKDLPILWEKLEKPYRNRRGKIVEWKPNIEKGMMQARVWDAFQERMSTSWEMPDFKGTTLEGMKISHSLSLAVMPKFGRDIKMKEGIVIIRGRRAWPKVRDGWVMNDQWKEAFELRKGDKVHIKRAGIKMWIKVVERGGVVDIPTAAWDLIILRDGNIRVRRWANLSEINEWLAARGLPMNRGGLVNDEGQTFWFDPQEGKYIVVFDEESIVYHYDENRDQEDPTDEDNPGEPAEPQPASEDEESEESEEESEDSEREEISLSDADIAVADRMSALEEYIQRKDKLMGRFFVTRKLEEAVMHLKGPEAEWIQLLIAERKASSLAEAA